MTAGALVAGNTVVLKPSEHDAASGALVGEAFAAAGLPEGVIGARPRRRRRPAARWPRARSTASCSPARPRSGRALGRRFQAGRTRGRRSPRWAARTPRSWPPRPTSRPRRRASPSSAYGFSGQKCSACSRAIVVGDAVARRARRAALPRAGRGARGSATPATATRSPGRSIDARAVARLRAAIAAADRDGAVVAGGAALDLPGHFVAPTVVAGLPAGHRLTREELFVPFVTVTRVGSFDEALAEANAVDYGLTAGVFSGDRRRARRGSSTRSRPASST